MMNLTFLGTGNAFCDYRINYHNNAFAHTLEGPLLLDCGGTAVQALKELNINCCEVAGVIITHMHGDHCGGLEQLIFERYYSGFDNKPGYLTTKIIAAQDILDLIKVYLSPCVDEYTNPQGETLSGGYDVLVEAIPLLPGELPFFPGVQVEVSSIRDAGDLSDGTEYIVGDISFRLFKTPHVYCNKNSVHKPAYSIMVHSLLQNRPLPKFLYSGDTTFRANIGDLFPGDYLIFHDCSFGPIYKGTVHTHYEELCTLSPDIKSRIYLMHYNVIPDGIEPLKDGFGGVARKHGVYSI